MWLMFLFIKIIITFSIEECFLIETMLLVHNPICYVIMAFNSKFVVVMLHLKRRQHLVLKYSVFTTVFGAKSNMWNDILKRKITTNHTSGQKGQPSCHRCCGGGGNLSVVNGQLCIEPQVTCSTLVRRALQFLGIDCSCYHSTFSLSL